MIASAQPHSAHSAQLDFVHVRADGLAPYVASLRAIEAETTYPIGTTDAFRIDHGERYVPFFSAMGDAHFLVARDRSLVVGGIVGVLKRVRVRDRWVQAMYLGDLKVRASHRGLGIARAMLFHGLTLLLRRKEFRGVRLIYGAAMRGARGDVMRSARGWHPMRLGAPLGTASVFFADPLALAALAELPLPGEGAPGKSGNAASRPSRLALDSGLDLSRADHADPDGATSTAGAKDLIVVSTGAPMPLVHAARSPGDPAWAEGLARIGARLTRQPGHPPAATSEARPRVCFSLDERLVSHHAWLRSHGVLPAASCVVYGFALPSRGPRPTWLHLSTSEI